MERMKPLVHLDLKRSFFVVGLRWPEYGNKDVRLAGDWSVSRNCVATCELAGSC
jgi:hypothetical protein